MSHSCTLSVLEFGMREPAIVAAGVEEGRRIRVEENSTPMVCGDGSRTGGGVKRQQVAEKEEKVHAQASLRKWCIRQLLPTPESPAKGEWVSFRRESLISYSERELCHPRREGYLLDPPRPVPTRPQQPFEAPLPFALEPARPLIPRHSWPATA